jgi:glucose/arabinose dehydrogenase
MKTKFKSYFHAASYSFGVGAVILTASSVQGQNLFVDSSGNIYEFTLGGVKSTFASGLVNPYGLAFNSAGDLFQTGGNGNIYKFTPGGAQSTFASGLIGSYALAFNSQGDLFQSDFGNGNITEFTPGGVKSTFASGLNYPLGLAFQGEMLPVPEPSVLGLLTVSATTYLIRRLRICHCQ